MSWLTPDGPPVTERLLLSRQRGGAVRRSDFNTYAWKPALLTVGVLPPPHFYASVLLDSGESVKALSGYLGHTDPGSRSGSAHT